MEDNEKAIIGHLIRFPERVSEIFEGLEAGDFASPKLKRVFEAIQEHAERGFDVLLLSKCLGDQ